MPGQEVALFAHLGAQIGQDADLERIGAVDDGHRMEGAPLLKPDRNHRGKLRRSFREQRATGVAKRGIGRVPAPAEPGRGEVVFHMGAHLRAPAIGHERTQGAHVERGLDKPRLDPCRAHQRHLQVGLGGAQATAPRQGVGRQLLPEAKPERHGLNETEDGFGGVGWRGALQRLRQLADRWVSVIAQGFRVGQVIGKAGAELGPIDRPQGLGPGAAEAQPGGAAIALEVWEVPSALFGSFVAGIPAPLGIGKVKLADGGEVPGFICEGIGITGATDITHFGGWRAWLAAGAPR